MCGIAGGIHPRIDRHAMEGALTAMLHRGPDEGRVFSTDQVFLGARRLAIVDLTGGSQPVKNEDGSIVAVFNGEIYNYPDIAAELRAVGHELKTNCDTEVLVHLYEEHGADFCARLHGMFAIALWDSRKRILVLGRDRFGKKPLYYSELQGAGIIFASELKSLKRLASAVGEKLELSGQAVYDYLSLGSVPQPATIYSNVSAVPPATVLTFDGRRTEAHRYWALGFNSRSTLPYAGVLEMTRELVKDAVKVRLRSDVPIGVFLSGGLDSGAVAYEASKLVGEELRTFTVSVPGKLDESAQAAATAARLKVRNTILPLTLGPLEMVRFMVEQYDQPFADSSAIPSIAVSRLARKHVTVVLNGDGGDEIFGGYRRYMAAALIDTLGPFAAVPGWALGRLLANSSRERRSTVGLLIRLMRGSFQGDGARYLTWTPDLLTEPDKQLVWQGPRMRATEELIEASVPSGLSRFRTQQAGDFAFNLLSGLLVKMDMATMSASLEARSPLLDHRLVEFLATVPDQMLLRGFRSKAVLRDAYLGRLPDEVVKGPKRGFEIPLQHWIDNALRETIMDTLGSPGAKVFDFLDRSFVTAYVSGRLKRPYNNASLVFTLLVLELWLRLASSN